VNTSLHDYGVADPGTLRAPIDRLYTFGLARIDSLWQTETSLVAPADTGICRISEGLANTCPDYPFVPLLTCRLSHKSWATVR